MGNPTRADLLLSAQERPLPTATLMRDAEPEWSGMLSDQGDAGQPVAERYSDEELER